jgi:16S rRNA processing protein RimM
MKDQILIAKITSSHGIKGQAKLMSFSDNPENIKTYTPLFNKNGEEVNITIKSKAGGKNKDIFIIDLDGVSNKNEADELKNTELFINRDQLPEDDGEFYYVDLIGVDVIDENNKKIGKLIDVVNYGAGDIFEIEFNEASKQKEKVQMFSFREDIFPEINLEANFVKIIFPQIAEIK